MQLTARLGEHVPVPLQPIARGLQFRIAIDDRDAPMPEGQQVIGHDLRAVVMVRHHGVGPGGRPRSA